MKQNGISCLRCIISIILSLILLTVQSLSFKKLTLLEFFNLLQILVSVLACTCSNQSCQ